MACSFLSRNHHLLPEPEQQRNTVSCYMSDCVAASQWTSVLGGEGREEVGEGLGLARLASSSSSSSSCTEKEEESL